MHIEEGKGKETQRWRKSRQNVKGVCLCVSTGSPQQSNVADFRERDQWGWTKEKVAHLQTMEVTHAHTMLERWGNNWSTECHLGKKEMGTGRNYPNENRVMNSSKALKSTEGVMEGREQEKGRRKEVQGDAWWNQSLPRPCPPHTRSKVTSSFSLASAI